MSKPHAEWCAIHKVYPHECDCDGLEGVTCDYETPEGPCERGWSHGGDHDPFHLIRNPAGDAPPSLEVVNARLRSALTVASEMENEARESLYRLADAARAVTDIEVSAWRRDGEEVATLALRDCDRLIEVVAALRAALAPVETPRPEGDR